MFTNEQKDNPIMDFYKNIIADGKQYATKAQGEDKVAIEAITKLAEQALQKKDNEYQKFLDKIKTDFNFEKKWNALVEAGKSEQDIFKIGFALSQFKLHFDDSQNMLIKFFAKMDKHKEELQNLLNKPQNAVVVEPKRVRDDKISQSPKAATVENKDSPSNALLNQFYSALKNLCESSDRAFLSKAYLSDEQEIRERYIRKLGETANSELYEQKKNMEKFQEICNDIKEKLKKYKENLYDNIQPTLMDRWKGNTHDNMGRPDLKKSYLETGIPIDELSKRADKIFQSNLQSGAVDQHIYIKFLVSVNKEIESIEKNLTAQAESVVTKKK